MRRRDEPAGQSRKQMHLSALRDGGPITRRMFE